MGYQLGVMPASVRRSAVTFDCWNTLLRERDFRVARALRATALVEIAEGAGVAVSYERAGEAIRRAFDRHVELWVRGIGSGAPEIAGWALDAVGVANTDAARHLAPRLAEAALSGECEALPGAGDVLETLRSRGTRIALICDTGMSPGRVVRELLDRAGLLPYLEVLVFSNEVGVPKPHPSMFEAALGPLGVASADAVHVGDLRRTDVQGGRGYGMGTVRIRAAFDDPEPFPDADAVIDAHAELADALERTRAARD
jgi:putative hydrolase of the HAD superfamily